MSAFREGGRIVVAIPARLSRAEEREWVARMVAQLERKEAARRPSDHQLVQRAAELNAQYLDGRAVPTSVQWSRRQNKRWGSCTPSARSIRLSSRLQGMPSWVVDYVLLHELNHLLHRNHDAAFWAELARYPHHERAKAFLEGVDWAERAPESHHDDDGADDDEAHDDEIHDDERDVPGVLW